MVMGLLTNTELTRKMAVDVSSPLPPPPLSKVESVNEEDG